MICEPAVVPGVSDPFEQEVALPLSEVLWGLSVTRREKLPPRALPFFLLLAAFLLMTSQQQPTASVFEVQRALLQSLAERPIGGGGGSAGAQGARRNFINVTSYEDFWAWANTVLYEQVFNNSAHNLIVSRR